MPTQCFLVKPSPTNDCFLWLRRYVSSSELKCSAAEGYHDAMFPMGRIPSGFRRVLYNQKFPQQEPIDADRYVLEHNFDEIPRDDPRWPKACAGCGFEFRAGDTFQHFTSRIWEAEDGRAWPQRELPPGAMWFEDWLPRNYFWDNLEGPGHLMVMLPNGSEWNIDSRASNCTLPSDRTHRCWVRSGEPPNVTAGKGGRTCAAGAGSILAGSYHGFLQNGILT